MIQTLVDLGPGPELDPEKWDPSGYEPGYNGLWEVYFVAGSEYRAICDLAGLGTIPGLALFRTPLPLDVKILTHLHLLDYGFAGTLFRADAALHSFYYFIRSPIANVGLSYLFKVIDGVGTELWRGQPGVAGGYVDLTVRMVGTEITASFVHLMGAPTEICIYNDSNPLSGAYAGICSGRYYFASYPGQIRSPWEYSVSAKHMIPMLSATDTRIQQLVTPIQADSPSGSPEFPVRLSTGHRSLVDCGFIRHQNQRGVVVRTASGELRLRRFTPSLYALTVTYGTGDGEYAAASVNPIIADAPATGKEFDEWTGDIAYVTDVNDPTTDVTMPAAAVAVTATYSNILYALTVTAGTGGGNYIYQSVNPIVANAPLFGFVFAGWTGDVAYVTDVNNPTTTVTMPAAAVAVSATYILSPIDPDAAYWLRVYEYSQWIETPHSHPPTEPAPELWTACVPGNFDQVFDVCAGYIADNNPPVSFYLEVEQPVSPIEYIDLPTPGSLFECFVSAYICEQLSNPGVDKWTRGWTFVEIQAGPYYERPESPPAQETDPCYLEEYWY